MEDNGKKVEERVASSFLFFSFFYAEIHATRELINQENPGKPPLVGLSDWCIIKIAHIINRNTWHTELKIIMASRFANSLVVDQFQSLTIIELNFWIVLKLQNCTHLVTVCMCSDTRCIVDGIVNSARHRLKSMLAEPFNSTSFKGCSLLGLIFSAAQLQLVFQTNAGYFSGEIPWIATFTWKTRRCVEADSSRLQYPTVLIQIGCVA